MSQACEPVFSRITWNLVKDTDLTRLPWEGPGRLISTGSPGDARVAAPGATV